MQDLRQGNYIVMNEEYDRRVYDRAGRVSDRHRVYVCWSLDGERELFISRSCFYSRVTGSRVCSTPNYFELPQKAVSTDTIPIHTLLRQYLGNSDNSWNFGRIR